MGLTDALRRFATARPHLLVVEGPAGVRARLAVERFAREQGWPLVDGPADADLLVVAGEAGGPLTQYVDRLWDQLPGPRARVQCGTSHSPAQLLGAAQRVLRDVPGHHADARRTTPPPAAAPAGTGGPDMGGGPGGHDMGGGSGSHDMDGGPGGHDMGGGPGGHDMGGMALPAGLAMADRAADRDGLTLDVLSIPWGPALPWWPPGLVVTTVLQGDVVQDAQVEQLVSLAASAADWRAALGGLDPGAAAAVVRLDALMRLLAVAGWDGARLASQRVRDGLLAGAGGAVPALHRLSRRVRGSRPLRRMTAGVATTRGEDVAARYLRWLAEAVGAADGGSVPSAAPERPVADLLPGLLTGCEVAAVRLVVASLDLELRGVDTTAAAGV